MIRRFGSVLLKAYSCLTTEGYQLYHKERGLIVYPFKGKLSSNWIMMPENSKREIIIALIKEQGAMPKVMTHFDKTGVQIFGYFPGYIPQIKNNYYVQE